MASGTSLSLLLLPNFSLIAVSQPHPTSLWLPLLCVSDGWIVDLQLSRVSFPLLCYTSSLRHIPGSPMICVQVLAVTSYTLSRKNTLTSLSWGIAVFPYLLHLQSLADNTQSLVALRARTEICNCTQTHLDLPQYLK